MKSLVLTKINKRINFTSKYNVKLYKKCLSLKLIFSQPQSRLPNLLVSTEKTASLKTLKCIYARKETVPLRLLRFFFLLNTTYLISLGVKFLVARKLSVYNGKRAKPINVNKVY